HDRARAQGARVRSHHRRAARLRGRSRIPARGTGHPSAPLRNARAHGSTIVVDRRDAEARHLDVDPAHEDGRQGARPPAQAKGPRMTIAYPLTVYYDATCPLCRAEIETL